MSSLNQALRAALDQRQDLLASCTPKAPIAIGCSTAARKAPAA
jgi:hypothetical protein